MSSRPFISVIVPYLNEEEFIERCIRSLLDQEYDPQCYELIFVDNGSTDHSADIVRRYPQIMYLQERKPNVYAARNCGLTVAQGEIMAFTDADCTVERGWLAAIAESFLFREVGIVLGYRKMGRTDSRLLSIFGEYENHKAEYVFRCLPKDYYFGYTNNMAVRAELFKRYGAFREFPVAGDTEFVQRCVELDSDLRVAVLSGMEIHHQEIQEPSDWLRKLMLYGRHNQDLKRISRYRSLGIKDKYDIVLDLWSDGRSSFYEKMSLLMALALGQICYAWGMMSSRSRPC